MWIFDYLLFLQAFLYISGTEKAKKSTFFKEIHNYITLSLSESKITTAVDLHIVSENFSLEILNNLKLYEEHA